MAFGRAMGGTHLSHSTRSLPSPQHCVCFIRALHNSSSSPRRGHRSLKIVKIGAYPQAHLQTPHGSQPLHSFNHTSRSPPRRHKHLLAQLISPFSVPLVTFTGLNPRTIDNIGEHRHFVSPHDPSPPLPHPPTSLYFLLPATCAF